jgi:hypothetical protein
MEEKKIPTIRAKTAATPSQIEKELKRMYAGADPVDFTKIDKAKQRGPWATVITIVVVLFALAGIAWAGLLRFGGANRFGDRIAVTIDGPTEVRSGEVQTWTVRYRNDERLPIARAELVLRLPASITILDTTPLPTTTPSTWDIGTITASGEGTVTVRGRVVDALDAPVAIQAVLNYRPSNFNSDFQKVTSWSGRVNDAVVEVTITAPEDAVPGEDDTFAVEVHRRADLSPEAALPDLRVRFDPDHAVVIKKPTPEFKNADERAWVAAPPTDTPLQFSAVGSFASNVSGETPVRVEVGTVNASGDFMLLATASTTVKVLAGDLVLTVIRNGSVDAGTVELGGALHVSVDYENKGEKPITDPEIALTFTGYPPVDGGVIDWASLDDVRGGKRSGGTITWTKKEIPELATLDAGARGSIDISVKVTDKVFTTTDRAYGVDISARGKLGAIGGKRSSKVVSTPVITTLVNSDTRLIAGAAYASGNIPPQTGQTTTYKLVWTVTNSLHEISGIKVTGALPHGVNWNASGNVTAGDLRYDDSSRTITWTLNRLPTSIPTVSVDMLVNANPDDVDIGKNFPLISTATLTTTDKQTKAELIRTADALDSSLPGDPTNEGKGTVQP